MRRWLGLLLTLCAAAAAAAQDRDPFEAVYEAQRVREKQAETMKRADSRIVNPLMGEPLPPTKHAPNGTPIEIPRELGDGEASVPWLLPVLALGALVVIVGWRRSRPSRGPTPPVRPGLHRK